MKLALVLATLALWAGTARAEAFGYVDHVKMKAKSTEWQRLNAVVQSDGQTKQNEINAAVAAFQEAAKKKGSPNEVEALRQKAIALGKMNQADLEKNAEATMAPFKEHLSAVLAKLKAERHLTVVLPVVPLDAHPSADLTDEGVKRLNALDAQAIAEENTRLTEENARLKAEKTPPTPPKVPGAK